MKNNAVKNGKILNMALYSTAESIRNRLLFDAKTWCALHPAGVRRCHGEVRLSVKVDDQHIVSGPHQPRAQIYCGGGFPTPPFR